MNGTEKEQEEAIHYYDKISTIYDFISNWYFKNQENMRLKNSN